MDQFVKQFGAAGGGQRQQPDAAAASGDSNVDSPADDAGRQLLARIKSLEATLNSVRNDDAFPSAVKETLEKELKDARAQLNSHEPSLSRHTALGHKLQRTQQKLDKQEEDIK
eukprot:5407099-Pyramimonas_sp.AAC.1